MSGNIYSVIDIGSNTVKINIFKVENGKIEAVHNLSTRCQLGLCRDGDQLNETGIERLKNTVLLYLSESARYGAESVYAVATASLRGISNTERVLEEIKRNTGISIDIIDGETEARCSYLGLMSTTEEKRGAMSDMGGGSCELVLFDDTGIVFSESMPFGALTLRSRLKVSDVPTEADKVSISEYIKTVCPDKTAKTLHIVGGTARGLFKLYDTDEKLTLEQAKGFYSILESDPDIISKLKEVLPDRYDSFLTGFYAYITLSRLLGVEKICLCKAGVREGYLIKKLGL